MDIFDNVIVPFLSSPWVYLLIFICVAGDGILPPFPAETIVIPLAAISASREYPDLWALLLVAIGGAFVGDNIAYLIGRRLGRERLNKLQFRFVVKLRVFAETTLTARPAVSFFTFRNVPGGRIVLNLVAGALEYPHRDFVKWGSMSATVWGFYTVGVGFAAGSWFSENTVVVVIVAILFAMAAGFLADHLMRRATAEDKRAFQRSAK